METVGIVGVGRMGTAMLERLLGAGFQAVVYDTSDEAVARATALGARACESPADVGRAADIIHIVVRRDHEMVDCVLSEAGVLQALTPGKLLLLHSTVNPRTTQRIADAAKAVGVDVADAAMAGVPETLRAGDEAFYIGCEPELSERIRKHLLRIGKAAHYMGPVGSGLALKLIHNYVMDVELLVLHEAIRIGESLGISRQRFLEDVRNGPRVLDQAERRVDANGNVRNLFEQVLPQLKQLSEEAGLDLPVTKILAAADNPLKR